MFNDTLTRAPSAGPSCSKDGYSAIHQINHYPVDNKKDFVNTLIHWIVISFFYPIHSAIHLLNNRAKLIAAILVSNPLIIIHVLQILILKLHLIFNYVSYFPIIYKSFNKNYLLPNIPKNHPKFTIIIDSL